MAPTEVHRLNIAVGEAAERIRWLDANARGTNHELTTLAEAVQALGEFCTILDARLDLIITALDSQLADA